ncbi:MULTISPECIES: type I toxin-antitoxin system Fst family toxin [unclassified Enterococcus]|uniref:type I toxin-antitoxin system Fst family toxin n=1 Tax=unclassified Enterococcus TaxID=2608891 RepID=UPI0020CC2B47|nr:MULTISPECIES: type I toxin-antitoxin system Fst family toxin [unclassified Enterococcus]
MIFYCILKGNLVHLVLVAFLSSDTFFVERRCATLSLLYSTLIAPLIVGVILAIFKVWLDKRNK